MAPPRPLCDDAAMHTSSLSRTRDGSRLRARALIALSMGLLPVLVMAIPSGCAQRSSGASPDDAPSSAAAAPAAMAAQPAVVLENVTTAEGLRKQDTRLGVGEPCPSDAQVTINFVGKLADGTVFDSSERRQRPLEFRVNSPSLIRGLREGIPGMRSGGARTLYIPARLAYGETGREPIPPRADLIFEIELLSWTSDPAPR
jgi:FKBP-type peptidyl-prolyl cis-trans isomerase